MTDDSRRRQEYRGFTVVTGNYLGYGKFFYEIHKDDKEIFCTLWADDARWNNHDSAAESAKKKIDRLIHIPPDPKSWWNAE
jgi:hypothetical protein